MSKHNRREFLQQMMKLGMLSPAYIKLFEQTLMQNAFGQTSGATPRLLFIVYGEGQCQQMANPAKTSLYSASGNLINGSSSQLTKGMSGLSGIEQFSTIIQNVGVSHPNMYADSSSPYSTNRVGLGGSRKSDDHQVFNVSVLNGMNHCQPSIDQVLKNTYNKKIASFCSSPLVEDYASAAYSMAVTDSTGNGCSMQVPGFNFVTPDTTLNSLYNNLVGFGGSNNNNPTGSDAKKNMLSQLLPVIENVKSRVPGHAQASMDTYLQLVTNYRDNIPSVGAGSGSGGQGGGSGNTCNLSAGQVPDPDNSVGTGLKAAELMLKSMACSALDVGSLCFFPTNGKGNNFPGFSDSGGSYQYNGSIENFHQFLNQNVSHVNEFIPKMGIYGGGKSNHHCSHYVDVIGDGSWWKPEWLHESTLVNDYTNTNIHKQIFNMAKNITTSSGKRLSEELIVVTMYAQGNAHPHRTQNCPIILSTEGDFIQKNKVKVYGNSDFEVAADSEGQGQAHRRSEFLQALLKLIDPNTSTFGDARQDKIPDLKNLV